MSITEEIRGILDEKLDLGALLATGDQEKAVAVADKKIGAMFKKNLKAYLDYLKKETDSPWKAKVGDGIVSFDSDQGKVDIYWDYDVMTTKVDFIVEGPMGMQRFANQPLERVGSPMAPRLFFGLIKKLLGEGIKEEAVMFYISEAVTAKVTSVDWDKIQNPRFSIIAQEPGGGFVFTTVAPNFGRFSSKPWPDPLALNWHDRHGRETMVKNARAMGNAALAVAKKRYKSDSRAESVELDYDNELGLPPGDDMIAQGNDGTKAMDGSGKGRGRRDAPRRGRNKGDCRYGGPGKGQGGGRGQGRGRMEGDMGVVSEIRDILSEANDSTGLAEQNDKKSILNWTANQLFKALKKKAKNVKVAPYKAKGRDAVLILFDIGERKGVRLSIIDAPNAFPTTPREALAYVKAMQIRLNLGKMDDKTSIGMWYDAGRVRKDLNGLVREILKDAETLAGPEGMDVKAAFAKAGGRFGESSNVVKSRYASAKDIQSALVMLKRRGGSMNLSAQETRHGFDIWSDDVDEPFEFGNYQRLTFKTKKEANDFIKKAMNVIGSYKEDKISEGVDKALKSTAVQASNKLKKAFEKAGHKTKISGITKRFNGPGTTANGNPLFSQGFDVHIGVAGIDSRRDEVNRIIKSTGAKLTLDQRGSTNELYELDGADVTYGYDGRGDYKISVIAFSKTVGEAKEDGEGKYKAKTPLEKALAEMIRGQSGLWVTEPQMKAMIAELKKKGVTKPGKEAYDDIARVAGAFISKNKKGESYYYGNDFGYKSGRYPFRKIRDRAWVEGKVIPVQITGAVYIDVHGDIEETEYKEIVRLDTKEKLNWRELPDRTLRDVDNAMLEKALEKAQVREEFEMKVPNDISEVRDILDSRTDELFEAKRRKAQLRRKKASRKRRAINIGNLPPATNKTLDVWVDSGYTDPSGEYLSDERQVKFQLQEVKGAAPPWAERSVFVLQDDSEDGASNAVIGFIGRPVKERTKPSTLGVPRKSSKADRWLAQCTYHKTGKVVGPFMFADALGDLFVDYGDQIGELYERRYGSMTRKQLARAMSWEDVNEPA